MYQIRANVVYRAKVEGPTSPCEINTTDFGLITLGYKESNFI